MVASARSEATTGSHQVAAPIAMRMGIARGAVIGNHETSCAQRVSALPIVAKDTRKPSDEDDRHRAGQGGGVLRAGRERPERPEHRRVEGIAEHEPHDGPRDDAAAHRGDVDGVDERRGDERDPGRRGDLSQPEQADAR